jgi:hypothetical protein
MLSTGAEKEPGWLTAARNKGKIQKCATFTKDSHSRKTSESSRMLFPIQLFLSGVTFELATVYVTPNFRL